MRRICAAAALAVAVATTPVAATSTVTAPRAWLITRTVSARNPLKYIVKFTERRGQQGVGIVVGVEPDERTEHAFSTTLVEIGTGTPRVYGVDSPDCPQVCAIPASNRRPTSYQSMHVTDRWDVAVVVAAHRLDVSIRVNKGWRVSPLPATAFRYVTAADADATGVEAHFPVESFRSAQLPGGRYGSVAVATIPCGATGSGHVEFTGGQRRHELNCPRDWQVDEWFSMTPKRTTWRLSGEARGVGWFRTRLAVVDLPRLRSSKVVRT